MIAKWAENVREHFARNAPEKIGLILDDIDGATEGVAVFVVKNAHIVTGRKLVAAEPLCFLPEHAEFDLRVAAHAGIRCLTTQIGIGERLHHFAGKGFTGVEDVEIDAELCRHTARICGGLAVATAFRHETHMDADHFVASCLQKMDGDGAVDTAAESEGNFTHEQVLSCRRLRISAR